MLNQSDKIERFTEVINKTAEKQCKKIMKQTESFKEKEFHELEIESENELKNRISFEVSRIATETNKKISLLQTESKKKVSQVRDEITKSVFEKAKERLVTFTETQEYDALLDICIKNLIEEVGENAVIYVRKEDTEKAEKIAKSISAECEVKVTQEIEIGGAFASNKEESVFVYDTLESRLESQKEKFMASSGLFM